MYCILYIVYYHILYIIYYILYIIYYILHIRYYILHIMYELLVHPVARYSAVVRAFDCGRTDEVPTRLTPIMRLAAGAPYVVGQAT